MSAPHGPAAVPLPAHWPLLALLLGALSVGAFAPLEAPALAPLTLAGLFWLWSRATGPGNGRTAFGIGWCFGIGLFGAGVSWVYVSLHDFGMMPAPLAALATALFCAFLALFPAAVGALQARSGAPVWLRLALLVPALWTLAEWVRSWIFTGFPWLSMGYSQAAAPLAGYAPLAGVFGASFVLAVCAGLLAFALQGGGRQRLAALGAALLLAGAGQLLRQVQWTQPAGSPVSVALAQGNVPQSLKFEPGRYAQTLATYRRLATGTTAQLVVLPETAIPRLLNQVEARYLEDLRDSFAARQADLLLGAPLAERGGFYNSVVSLGVAPVQRYDKVHLVPFGEFIPPGFGWILNVLQIPLSDFSAGATTQQPLALGPQGGLRVAVNICYEDAFGTEIARQLPQATLLVNASNVAWFGDSLAPDQHLQIAQLRALETGRPMLRATNSGVTAIINAQGRVQARLPKFAEGLLEGSVQPMAGATPFVRAGNLPVLLLCALLVLTGRLRLRRGAPADAPAAPR